MVKLIIFTLLFAVVQVLCSSESNKMNTKILQYKVDKKDKWIAIHIHKSQMLWLRKNDDYALIRFTLMQEQNITSTTAYEYKFFDGKTQTETRGKDFVYEISNPPNAIKKKKSKTRIKFGSFDILWSTSHVNCCFIYVCPDEFDMRVLPATLYEKYQYYPPKHLQ